ALPPSRFEFIGHSFTLEELGKVRFPSDDSHIANLLYRFFYSRMFAKFYFGAGFGHLSLVAGFHHLAILYCLIKLHAQGLALCRKESVVAIEDVAATLRQLEKGLGETVLDGYAAGLWELLMFSDKRVKRLLSSV